MSFENAKQRMELGSKYHAEVASPRPSNTQETLIDIIREQNNTLTYLVGIYRKLGMPIPPSGPEEPRNTSEKEPLPILNLIDIAHKNQQLITIYVNTLTHI